MRVTALGMSPNTWAAIVGTVVVVALIRMNRFAWIIALTGGMALILSQSRSACIALLAVAGLLFARVDKQHRNPASILLFIGMLGAGWAALHGRASLTSLSQAGSSRIMLAEAALIRAAERTLHGFDFPLGLAEDAALRFDFPVSVEQTKVIRAPLSSILQLLDLKTDGINALRWLGIFAPAIWLILRTFRPLKLPTKIQIIDSPSPAANWHTGATRLSISAGCLYLLICSAYNDLHQNPLGRGLIEICAFAGLLWLYWQFRHHDWKGAFFSTGLAVAIAVMLLGYGEWRRSICYKRDGVDTWTMQTQTTATGQLVRVTTGNPNPHGTVLILDHVTHPAQSLVCRQAIYRLAGRGWRIIEAPVSIDINLAEATGTPQPPFIVVACGGPAKESLVRNLRPDTIVAVSPSLPQLLSSDGGTKETERYWITATERSREEILEWLGTKNRDLTRHVLALPRSDSHAWRDAFAQIAIETATRPL